MDTEPARGLSCPIQPSTCLSRQPRPMTQQRPPASTWAWVSAMDPPEASSSIPIPLLPVWCQDQGRQASKIKTIPCPVPSFWTWPDQELLEEAHCPCKKTYGYNYEATVDKLFLRDRLSAPSVKKTDPITATTAKRDQQSSEPVDFTSNSCSYNFTSTSSTSMAGVPSSSVLTDSDTSAVTDSLSRYKNSATAGNTNGLTCRIMSLILNIHRLPISGLYRLLFNRLFQLRSAKLRQPW